MCSQAAAGALCEPGSAYAARSAPDVPVTAPLDLAGPVGALSTAALEREIASLAAHIAAAMCRWLELIAEYDLRDGWGNWDCKSLAHWVAWRCAVRPGVAREYVRVARRLRELPLITEAFRRGELSYSKVRALTRVEHVEDEEGLLMMASHASAAQVERLIGAYRGVAAVAAGAERAQRERELSWYYDGDGSLVIHGRLPADQGAVVVAALEAMRDRLLAEAPKPPPDRDAWHGPPDPAEELACPAGATNADALVLLADTALAHREAARTGGDRVQVVVHVDADVLSGAAERCAQLEDGESLAPETARRLACDASVVTLTEGADGTPLHVAHKRRTVPPSLRRALRARQDCCQFPGCTRRRALHAHHLEHWAHGGATRLDNLIHLCPRHHHLVHEGGYTLARDADGQLVVHRPNQAPLSASPHHPRGDHGRLAYALRHLDLDADALTPHGYEPMHLDLQVDALLAVAPIERQLE